MEREDGENSFLRDTRHGKSIFHAFDEKFTVDTIKLLKNVHAALLIISLIGRLFGCNESDCVDTSCLHFIKFVDFN